jgi:eukaryotic-like serine/threonine-protein kinase
MNQQDRQRWETLQDILAEALEADPLHRDFLVEERCAGQPGLAREVRSLLAAAEGADEFFDGISRRSGALFTLAEEESPPQPRTSRFGPYRLVRQIGAGGMGAVYYAERADDLFQKGVAVKLLPPGMGTEGLLRRFAEERRILARLQHAGIAGLLDGGVAEDGTPFFVLEYVDGQPIDRYCRERRLSVEERLQLFLQVCETVDYAHRNLVVHRDLKPSNIMVTAEGRAKLLDFGIAKVLDVEEGEEDPQLTRIHGRPLTPGFAAPEQMLGENLTTSADVYSLGVLLYLLLSGRPPYDLGGLTPAQAERVICEEVPPLPSEAVTGAPADSPGGSPGGSPGRAPATLPSWAGPMAWDGAERLRRRLKGDLDVIVMKALQKDPARRYASVRALAEDIQRHCAGHPVRARPDTVGYRVSRFVLRNRTLVAAYLVISGLLAGFTGLAAYTAFTSRAQARVIALERDRAQLESEKAEAVAQFLIGLFGANDPNVAAGESLTALELLEQGERNAAALDDQPAVQTRMLDVMGQVYTRLGRYDRAEPLFRQALQLQRGPAGGPDADLAGVLDRLGNLLQKAGELDEATALLEEAVAVAAVAGAHRVQADALNDLGLVQYARGDYATAERSHRAALALRSEHLGQRHERVAASLQNLALVLSSLNRGEEAEGLYRRALDIYRERVGPEHTDVAVNLNALGRLLMERGDFEEAELLMGEALRIQRVRLGPRHPDVARSLNDVAAGLARQGDFAAAEEMFREALDIREETLGPDHPYVAISLNNLSFTLLQQGKLDEALPLRERAYALALERLGDAHDNTGIFAHNLAEVLDRLGRVREAEHRYREAVAILDRAFPDGHPLSTRPLLGLGELLLRQGRAAEAEPLLRSALAIRRSAGSGEAEVAVLESALGSALTHQGFYDEAESLLRSADEVLSRVQGPDSPQARLARERLATLAGVGG